MEAQARVLWDFLRLSYQRGLLDDLTALGDLLNPDMDLVDALEAFEDAVMAMNLGPFTTIWQQVQPLLMSLTTAKSIDALRAILRTLQPLLALLTARREEATALLQNATALAALKPHIMVLLAELTPVISSAIQNFVREDAGRLMGRGLNAVSEVILQAQTRQPVLVDHFFRELLHSLDAKQLGAATEVVLGGFLDQRPKIIRWTLGTTFTRIKKRFARS